MDYRNHRELMDISYKKKQISNGANAIIREYVEKYEKGLKFLDKEAADMLNDFHRVIKLENRYPLDPSISLRIFRLLLSYYQSVQDPEQPIFPHGSASGPGCLCKCSRYDRQYVLNEGRKIVDHVLGRLGEISVDAGPIVGTLNKRISGTVAT